MSYHIRVGSRGREVNAHVRRSVASTARKLLFKTMSREALPELDAVYQRQLAELMRVRRAVASVATSRKRLELQIGQMEEESGEDRLAMGTGQDPIAGESSASREGTERRLAELRQQYVALEAEEEHVFAASRRLQVKVEAFRAAKEAAETAYVAAEEAQVATWAEVTGNADADATGAGSGTSPQN